MKLKELRNQHNLTQIELGKIMKVTSQTILNWENGIYEPCINQLIALADLFKVTLDYLVERKQSIQTAEIVCNELKKIKKEDFLEFIKNKISK